MEDEDGYMVLEHRGKRGAAGSPAPLRDAGSGLPEPRRGFAPRPATVLAGAPRCLLGALMAALVLSLVVCVSWLVAERGRREGTAGCGNASRGCRCAGSGCASLELRKSLCPPREGEGCRLCSTGWTLHGTKCYWVAEGIGPWRESREDCANRGAELLMPGHPDELRFVKAVVQKPTSYFWIGLSIPSGGKEWTWLNGSRLDQSRFPLSPQDEGRSCGVVRGDRISSDSCSSGLQWICQKEAAQL